MPNVTYHDHTAGSGPSDGTAEIPAWNVGTSTVEKWVISAFKRYRVNPSSVSAAGTTQTGAQAISNSFDFHSVGTVGAGAGTKFTALAASEVGQRMILRVPSTAANSLIHYPSSGGKINDQANDVGITINIGAAIEFLAVSTINWITIP